MNFTNGAQLLEYCEKNNKKISEAMFERETVDLENDVEKTRARMKKAWSIMKASANKPLKEEIVSIALQFGMWLAPIMYWEGMFQEQYPQYASLIGFVFKINPFYYIVAGYRDSLLTGNWFFERPMNTLYFWGVTILIFYIGLKLFTKLRPHFSDVL